MIVPGLETAKSMCVLPGYFRGIGAVYFEIEETYLTQH